MHRFGYDLVEDIGNAQEWKFISFSSGVKLKIKLQSNKLVRDYRVDCLTIDIAHVIVNE